MAEQLNLKAAGLYLDANALSEAPAGAMSQADDVVISRPGVVESRRGFNLYRYSQAPVSAGSMCFFRGFLVGHGGSTLFYDNGGTWASYAGTIQAPSTDVGARVRFFEASQNLYLVTNAGVLRLDAPSGTPTAAGAPKALDPTCTTGSTGTGLWLTNGYQAAYAVTWSFTDANGNVHEGAPSGRVVFSNTGASPCTVSLSIPILSAEVTTSYVCKVYRTAQFANGTDPGAELQLVYQRNPTSTEVTNGALAFEDVVPDALRSATAYFAPSQEGLAAGNESPPKAKDLCLFRGTMFYANTTGRQILNLSLLSVGGTAGLADGDVITVNGVAYTAKATPAAATDFQLTTSGTVSQNIEATARALVGAINKYYATHSASEPIGAYYFSGELDPPGKVLLQERGLGGAAFSVTASAHGTAWSPQLPTSGTSVASAADVKPNRLMWSKYQQPESVPLLNFADIGSGNADILRILALRDSLIILKEDGAYRLTGDAGFFRVDLLDPTAVLVAAQTAAVVNNRVFGWFTQGVLAVSDTGAESLSFGRVDSLLGPPTGASGSHPLYSVGIGSDASRQYTLIVATYDGAERCLAYNYFTDTWAKATFIDPAQNYSLCTDSTGVVYLGDGNRHVFAEHITGTDLECADWRATVSIASVASATSVTVAATGGAQVGDILWQSDSAAATIAAINGTTLTLASPGASWSTGNASILKPLSVAVKYLPATAGTAYAKQFTEAAFLFEQSPPSALTATFATDLGASASVSLAPGLSSNPGEMWTWVPPECQRCGRLTVQLTHSVAGARLRLLGVSLKARTYGERRFGR